MKAILFLLLGTVSGFAQYVAVTFQSPPAPTNLWAECNYQSHTNTNGKQVLFTVGGFNAYMQANAASFEAWKTNSSNPQVKLAANMSRIAELWNQIPAARAQVQSIAANSSMTQAQAIAAVKVEANILDGILEELQRLGPVLKQIYKPEDDSTQ